MNFPHYFEKCSQRPVISASILLILFVIFSVLVASMVSMSFGNAEGWNASGAGGQWAGAFITFVGFVFVLLQLKRETREIHNQTKWQVYSNGFTTLSMFVDHPELRSYFYDENIPVPENPLMRARVFAATEMLCDHWESTILSVDSMNSGVNELWLIYMLGIYCKSPVLREFLKNENEGYRYSDELKDLLQDFPCPKIQQFKSGEISAKQLLSGVN